MRIDRKTTTSSAQLNKLLIRGKTLKQGVPISCKVRAYSRNTGQLLSEASSKLNGDYVILGIRNTSNYIIALDPNEEYNVAAQDGVK